MDQQEAYSPSIEANAAIIYTHEEPLFVVSSY
jgi:hypothetical protein